MFSGDIAIFATERMNIEMVKDLLIVGMGSFIGGAARYLVSFLTKTVPNGFPWATFSVNIIGCLLIGLLWGWSNRCPNIPQQLSLFLSVGICGGFTTFSTFSKESLALLQSGCYLQFALYVIGSVIIGILAVALGLMLTK